MSRNYQKPPLVEALCEFQFHSDGWDWTIPGLVYQKIQANFPKKHEINKFEFEFKPEEPSIKQQLHGALERMQFRNEDESALIQIGPDVLAVNSLRPYLHWHNFRTLILEMLEIYRGISHPTGLRRIGLRYINRIEIPTSGIDLSAYFGLEPRLPDEIPHQFKTLFMRNEIPYSNDNGLLILTFGTAPENQPEKSDFVLDLDFVTIPENQFSFESVDKWIETAHQHVEIAFEACITDALRKLFQEIKL